MGAASGLRQQILAEFGVDLPLEGGSGLLEDPYLLACESAVEAANAQLELLHILGKRRRQPWRLQGIEIPGGEDGSLIRAGIERLERHEKEVIAERASCYFRFQQIRDPVSVLTVADAGGHVDPRSGVRLPFQLGWLHLDHATDNEADTPGLGWTVTYESTGMQGTVFVYDHCEPLTSEDVESERVLGEFERAVGDAIGASPGAEVKHQVMFREPSGRGRCLLAILDCVGDSMSAVLLTTSKGCFVKMRITFDASEREFGRMAHESMEAFVDAMRPEARAVS